MKYLLIPVLLVLPMVASAQNLGAIENLVTSIGSIVDLALPIVATLAVLAFFWGLAKFIFASGDEDKSEDGKRIMLWGAVALFVMFSIWGIIRWVGNVVGIQETGGSIQVPRVIR